MVTFALSFGAFSDESYYHMNYIKHLLLPVILLVLTAGLNAQQDSDVLFTVDGQDVTVGEFRYIYTKTNGDVADFSKESVMEYLDLYQRFKLKVARAREMGLDTIVSLQRELEGYRKQLADNYLIDNQVTDKLITDLYERQQTDIDFSHILFQFKGNPLPEDTLALYKRAMELKKGLDAAGFAAAASEYSDDKYSKTRGGRIGFATAPFPRGLHRLEAALYQAPKGKVIGPIRTDAGYHLAIKEGSRPARGEMEVAHLFARKPADAKGTVAIPTKLQSAKKLLDDGQDFGKIAKIYSEDSKTKNNDGYLGFFGINRYEPAFENAAFSLTEDGQVSDIIETSSGFHIIKRISRKANQPLSDVRPLLEKKVKADGRYADAKKQMLRDIRNSANTKENTAVFGRYAATLVDSTFLNYRWKPARVARDEAVLEMDGGYKVMLSSLQEYLRKNSRKRVSLARSGNSFTVAKAMYEEWVDVELMAYAESRLERDYPEFAALMREYREGILLFEATKIEVWDKASQDTTGLKAFFAENAKNYQWEKRAAVSHYELRTASDIDINELYAFAATNGVDKTLDKFGRANVNASTEKYELARLADLQITKPQVGARSVIKNDLKAGMASFYKVEELLPARNKELKEARGYVIADYQDKLEREWVEMLRQQFPIKVNKKVLSKLIKS
ncbi:peptidyl-prolyl cis-trans isomerase SurA [Neolewinella agarilytica]|uniref:peptidylprolyl isomerase n=2 Tax=Neolewinella agarilytica TaxID=478744 RepID=A0A1H9KBC7_9BACT|nr:peptidyl-prolyl cis-trans isomerase SurA [Neolewinella agarilytica]